MPKVSIIDEEELVYQVISNPPQYAADVVEVTDEFLTRYHAVKDAFDAMQNELVALRHQKSFFKQKPMGEKPDAAGTSPT